MVGALYGEGDSRKRSTNWSAGRSKAAFSRISLSIGQSHQRIFCMPAIVSAENRYLMIVAQFDGAVCLEVFERRSGLEYLVLERVIGRRIRRMVGLAVEANLWTDRAERADFDRRLFGAVEKRVPSRLLE